MDPNYNPYSDDPSQYWDYTPANSYYMPPPTSSDGPVPDATTSPQHRAYSRADFPESYADAFGKPDITEQTVPPPPHPPPQFKPWNSPPDSSGGFQKQNAASEKRERRNFFGRRTKKKEAKVAGQTPSNARSARPLPDDDPKFEDTPPNNDFGRTTTETSQKSGGDPLPSYLKPEPQTSVPSRRSIAWTELPREELHPLSTIPVLPEGWDWRIDDQNRLFYVDTYARGRERRCFWQPPRPEGAIKYSRDWKRVCNLFGRVYWVPEWNKRMKASYIHPSDKQHYYGHPDEEDEAPFCYMSDEVWQKGISDEAVAVRGELWWGNSSVVESNLKFTERVTVEDLEPLLQEISLDGRNPQETVVAKEPPSAKEAPQAKEAPPTNPHIEEKTEKAKEPQWHDAPEHQPAEKPEMTAVSEEENVTKAPDPKPVKSPPTREELQTRVDEILKNMASKRAKQNQQS